MLTRALKNFPAVADLISELEQVRLERDEARTQLQEGLRMANNETRFLNEENDRLERELEEEKVTGNEYRTRQFNRNNMIIAFPIEYSSDDENHDETLRSMERDIISFVVHRKRFNQENAMLRAEINSLREQREQPDEENLFLRCAVCFNDVNVRGTGFSVSDCQHALCTMCSKRCNVCPICRKKTDYTKIIFN